jgi:hypothetical protein
MTILQDKDVEAILNDVGGEPQIFVEGGPYQIPTIDWVTGKFTESFQQFELENDLQAFREATNCCRHYSRAALFVANKCQDDARSNYALAFGYLTYVRLRPDMTLAGHAINFFITKVSDEDKPIVKFYEPQTYSIVELSPLELTTIRMMLV